MEKTSSGRPLRREFEGLMFLPTEQLRIIELEQQRDVIRPWADVIDKLGAKAQWAEPELLMNGFIECGNLRVELWPDRGEL